MSEALPLPLSLTASVGSAFVVCLAVWVLFPRLIGDEAGLRLLRGIEGNRPGALVTAVLTAVAGVLAWIYAFLPSTWLSDSWADLPILVAVGLAAGATGWLYWIDSSIHRLPDRIVLPLTGAVVLLLLVSMVVGLVEQGRVGDERWAGAASPAVNGLIGGLAMMLLFVLVNIVGAAAGRRSIGGGDIKLAAVVGILPAILDLRAPLLAIVVMCVCAVIRMVSGRLAGNGSGRRAIAFGPDMLIGAWTAVMLSPLLL